MRRASVRADLAEHAPDIEILEATTSTVALAAATHGVEPARLDNRRFKDRFGAKAKMLDAAEVLVGTSHPVGGVCPFGLPRSMRTYADVSMRGFDIVCPVLNTTVR